MSRTVNLTAEQALTLVRQIEEQPANREALMRVEGALRLYHENPNHHSPMVQINKVDAELLVSALRVVIDVADKEVEVG